MTARPPKTLRQPATGERYSLLGYRAAQRHRESGRSQPLRGSADLHARYDRDLLARLGTEFDRDNTIFEAIVNRMVQGIVGVEGFALQATTKSKRLNRMIEDDWREFAKAPEVRGLFPWAECQKLVLRSVVSAGDVGQLATERQRFQYFESEQITSSRVAVTKPCDCVERGAAAEECPEGHRVVDGVETDCYGRPVRFYVAPYSRDGSIRVGVEEPYGSDVMRLIAHRKRFSQTRGIPVGVPAYPMLHRINDVLDANAVAWQMLSKFAVAITREGAADAAFNESEADGDGRESPPDLADRVVELDEAIIFHGEDGEKVEGVARNLPGGDFGESVRIYLRLIGMPFGLPLEVILLDWSKTNYTASRAALEQTFKGFVGWQRFLKREHCTPTYETWLGWQLASNPRYAPYRDRQDIYAHGWDAPEFPWIDQLKEAQAWGERMDRGLATHTGALQSVSMDRETFLQTRSREIQDAMRTAREINAANTDMPPLDWRTLVGMPVGKTEAAARVNDGGGDANPDE